MDKVSVIIPTYNGNELLRNNLPSLLAAIDLDSGHEIIIADDGSTDDTADFIKSDYPQLRFLSSSQNQGFANTCNAGVVAASNDIIILLNNDIRVEEGFLAPLIKHLKNDDVFAVGAKVFFDKSQKIYHGKIELNFHLGVFQTLNSLDEDDYAKHSYTAYVAGGMAAYNRRKFLDMGGFSDIYAPFYWEDVDLCYRAWRRGWKSIFEPDSVMHHAHQGTIGKFYSQKYIEAIRERNSILFIWRNVTDLKLLAKHFFWLPLVIIRHTLRGRFFAAGVIISSLSKLSSIRKLLLAEKQYHKNSDTAILDYPRMKF